MITGDFHPSNLNRIIVKRAAASHIKSRVTSAVWKTPCPKLSLEVYAHLEEASGFIWRPIERGVLHNFEVGMLVMLRTTWKLMNIITGVPYPIRWASWRCDNNSITAIRSIRVPAVEIAALTNAHKKQGFTFGRRQSDCSMHKLDPMRNNVLVEYSCICMHHCCNSWATTPGGGTFSEERKTWRGYN
jgi:hypothetical protein